MSDTVTTDVLLEQVKAVQNEISRLSEAVQRVTGEVRTIRTTTLVLVESGQRQDSELAALKSRIERIERRLELND